MSSGLPPHGRSWKPADRPGPPPSGPRPGWHPTERPAPRAWNARRLLIALAAVATVATAAVFAAVLLWPRPPRPVRLVLIGAGYETNLAVPHNVPGRQGLRDLGHWAEDHNTRWGRRGRPLLEVRAGELGREGDAVARGLQDCHASVVVLFLGAHGGADADGAFFLAHDADLADDTSLYRLDRVLDQLRNGSASASSR